MNPTIGQLAKADAWSVGGLYASSIPKICSALNKKASAREFPFKIAFK